MLGKSFWNVRPWIAVRIVVNTWKGNLAFQLGWVLSQNTEARFLLSLCGCFKYDIAKRWWWIQNLNSDARLYRKACDNKCLQDCLHWERATATIPTRLDGDLNVSSLKWNFEFRSHFAQTLGVDVSWALESDWREKWSSCWVWIMEVNTMAWNQPELLVFDTWAEVIYVLRKRLKVSASSDVINYSQNTWLYSHWICCSD